MAEIRIEANQVFGNQGHLYLVFVDDVGQEFVIRGGPAAPIARDPLTIEVNVPMDDSRDNRPIADRDARGSIVIDLEGRDAAQVWEIMVQQAQGIADAQLPYVLIFQNSNSTIASVLHSVGINVADFTPDQPDIGDDNYPAIGNNLTAHVRELSGENGRDIIVGGENGDLLRGGENIDTLFGGFGDDLLYASSIIESESITLDNGDTIAGFEREDPGNYLVGGGGADIYAVSAALVGSAGYSIFSDNTTGYSNYVWPASEIGELNWEAIGTSATFEVFDVIRLDGADVSAVSATATINADPSGFGPVFNDEGYAEVSSEDNEIWMPFATYGSTTWYALDPDNVLFDDIIIETRFIVVDTREEYTDENGNLIEAETYVFVVSGGNGGPDSGYEAVFFSIDFTFENFLNGDFGIYLEGYQGMRAGTAGDDGLDGNDLDDTFFADAGNDSIDGRDGIDTAQVDGTWSDFAFGADAAGADFTMTDMNTTSGIDDGTDRLTNIEQLDFSDGSTGNVVNGDLTRISLIDAAGLLVANTVIDTADLRNWSSYIDILDTDGNRDTRIMDYDDGRVYETDFVDGVRSSVFAQDIANAVAWHTLTQNYDENGIITDQIANYDDGRVFTTDFVDGVRATQFGQDVADIVAWDTLTRIFDDNGLIASQIAYYDDGRVYENTYENGVLASQFGEDVDNVFAWATRETFYDDMGNRTSLTITLDDGTINTILFDDVLVA